MSVVEARWTLGTLLRDSGLPRAEAEILLRGALDCERIRLIAHPEEPVDPSRAQLAQSWFARRRSGEPVAYITGAREFYGLMLRVTPDVLIPRPETEGLVELALARLGSGKARRVLELGTGSGAICIALATRFPDLRIAATDISEAALEVARGNARDHAVRIDFVRSRWFESVEGSFDLVVANPPYVAAGDPHLGRGDLRFEPRLALLGGEDGLACVREIAAQARRRLLPGGSLLLEHGFDQGERCASLLRDLGYSGVSDFPDLAGLPRVCAATWGG